MDVLAHDQLSPWHDLARPYGWGAAAFLPLHRDGVVIGGLGFYANEADRFDVKSQQLLLDLVGGIDVALDRLSLESAREVLKTAFLNAPKDGARARAALDGLIALGGPATAQLLDGTARDKAAPYILRSLAVIGRTRMNPSEGAKLAIAATRLVPT
jgi:hypothetical protein